MIFVLLPLIPESSANIHELLRSIFESEKKLFLKYFLHILLLKFFALWLFVNSAWICYYYWFKSCCIRPANECIDQLVGHRTK